jgi:Protein of unknown function (DUF3995)
MKTARSAAIRRATTAGLVTAAGLHVAWGLGSNFPFASPDEFVDKVVGRQRRPSRRDCFAVAIALGIASTITAVPARHALHRATLDFMTGAFAIRAALGFTDHAHMLGLGGLSPAFRRRDRYLYAPICAALAAGSCASRRASKIDAAAGAGRPNRRISP